MTEAWPGWSLNHSTPQLTRTSPLFLPPLTKLVPSEAPEGRKFPLLLFLEWKIKNISIVLFKNGSHLSRAMAGNVTGVQYIFIKYQFEINLKSSSSSQLLIYTSGKKPINHLSIKCLLCIRHCLYICKYLSFLSGILFSTWYVKCLCTEQSKVIEEQADWTTS